MEELRKRVDELFSLLSIEQKEKPVLELEDNSENEKIIKYLEDTGPQGITYEIDYESRPSSLHETGGSTNLWYKKPENNSWVILIWQINKIIDRSSS